MVSKWTICLTLGWLTGSATAADICKWTDETGAAVYSMLRPIGRKCEAMIEVTAGAPIERRPAESRQRRLEQDLKVSEAARVERGRLARAQGVSEAEQAHRCENAMAELKFLEEATAMRMTSASDSGETAPRALDKAERAEVINAWGRRVAYWCMGAGDAPPEDTAHRVRSGSAPPRSATRN